MPILTFPWDNVGACSGLDVTEKCHTLRTEYSAGYIATRAKATKMPKAFGVTWRFMRFEEWLALVEFWRSVHGSADAFYFEFPIAMYDVGAFGGDDLGEEDPGGWDSEGDGIGFGSGPVFLVRFAEDTMLQKHKKPFYWGVKIILEEVA